jgi:L-ascorbate metabolism protein UlaG (beta-lactamase superfamily)
MPGISPGWPGRAQSRSGWPDSVSPVVIRWYGQSAFLIAGDKKVFLDPFGIPGDRLASREDPIVALLAAPLPEER